MKVANSRLICLESDDLGQTRWNTFRPGHKLILSAQARDSTDEAVDCGARPLNSHLLKHERVTVSDP
jgi:hypothetical protein